MKFNRAALILSALVAAVILAVRSPLLAVLCFMAAVLVLHPVSAVCRATLTVSEILSDVIEAAKLMLPALRFFSSDMSAERVKFGQTVIAHIPTVPSVFDYSTTTGYRQNAIESNTLLTDVPIVINKWKHVPIKLTMANLSADRSQNYLRTIANSGYALAKAVCDDALGKASRGNFSNNTTELIANTTRDTLGKARKALNTQKAGSPRFGVASSDFFEALEKDSRIASKDYYGQQTGGQPFGILRNVAGFQEIIEYPDFSLSAATQPLSTFATTDVNVGTDKITIAKHGLVNGDRVRVASTVAVPAGLVINTNYFVVGATADDFQLSATSGGAAINITDQGTGTHTLYRYELCSFFGGDSRAVAIATRLPMDGIEVAQLLGIPTPIKMEVVQDSDTGLAIAGFGEFDTQKHDCYITATVMFGSVAGGQGTASSKCDFAGHLVVTA